MNIYFISILIPDQYLTIFKKVLIKYNPFFKFLPPYIPLTNNFESELSSLELKEYFQEINQISPSFNLFFKGLIKHKRNTYLKLQDGEKSIKKLRLFIHSKELLKKQGFKNLINHPLLALDKSPDRVSQILPINSIPTLNININSIHIIQVNPNKVADLSYKIDLI